MNADALRTLLHTQPFEPFEIILSSGDRYAVKHPEMILILKNRVLVASDPRGPRQLPDSYITISYLHIAGAEPLGNQKHKSTLRRS